MDRDLVRPRRRGNLKQPQWHLSRSKEIGTVGDTGARRACRRGLTLVYGAPPAVRRGRGPARSRLSCRTRKFTPRNTSKWDDGAGAQRDGAQQCGAARAVGAGSGQGIYLIHEANAFLCRNHASLHEVYHCLHRLVYS